MSRRITFLVLLTVFCASFQVCALEYVDDFGYSKPASDSYTSGIFEYNIIPMPNLTYTSWDISDTGNTAGNLAIDLWPAMNEVTFDIGPSEYVDYVKVDAIDWGGSTTFEVIGTKATYKITLDAGSWNTLSSTSAGQDLGEITMVKLSSYEGGFDNLTANVVPEPATVMFLGAGLVFFGLTNKKK